MKISESTITQVCDTARIEEVIGHFMPLKKKGKDLKGECPNCGSDSFSVSPAKKIYKCFACEKGGNTAIDFLMNGKNFTYPDAIKWIADYYNIPVQIESNLPVQRPKLHLNGKPSFRDEQLKASGLTDEDQKCLIKKDDGTEVEIDLYEAATLNEKWAISPGDDLVMHYIDLYGKPIHFNRKGFSRDFELIRVRWQNPNNHLDKNGDPIKYQSPKDSGTAIWIPNRIRMMFKNKIQFDTLYIQEGEKKADKACKHGLPSVGIMGIHNIAYNKKLPHEFELIIKFCGVKKVVFIVDSDWNDISTNLNKPVDLRPKTFLSAINNFKDYFFAFNNIGINLDLFFAYIKNNDSNDKGIDDLLVNTLKDKEEDLCKDFLFTMQEKSGEGKYINCHKITGSTYYNLQQYFNLHDITHNAFANFHYEKLKDRKVFQIGRQQFKFETDENGIFKKDENGKYIVTLAQKIGEDEKFWIEEKRETKYGDRTHLKFDYENAYKFLYKRGYARYSASEGKFIFIHNENMILREVESYEIKDFIIDFTKQIGHKDLTNLIYRGAKMYVGSDSLSNLDYINPVFHRCEKSLQYLYFQESYWKITAEGIKEIQLNQLDGYIWHNKIIDFNAKYLNKPMFSVAYHPSDSQRKGRKKRGSYDLHIDEDSMQCHFLRFLYNTSNFFWEQEKSGEPLSDLQLEENKMHFLSKITAIGYLLHTYRNDNVAKAVIAMDGKVSEVGQSNGRSGKSLMGTALQELIPTCYIPGKQKDLTDDKFLFEEVNDRTCLVWIDDVRVNLDFEFFFPMITGQMKVEGKGIRRYTIKKELTPKLFITTNHAINGNTDSFIDRQILVAFSDYYHKSVDGREHRPVDDFGVMFFTEWDYNQRNLFMNFMACCLVTYFQHGIIDAPQERLQQRRLRQQIGEAIIEWAEEYFHDDNTLGIPATMNVPTPKMDMANNFYERFPRQKQFIDVREFKKRLRLLCDYKKWMLNPGKQMDDKLWGGDDKRSGIEYFTVANENYTIDNKHITHGTNKNQ